MAPRRDRDPSTIPWVVAKCLLLGAFVALGISAYLAFSPLKNPDVQDCGSALTHVLFNKSDVVVDFGRLDNPESVRLAQQPTCTERAVPRLQEAMIGFGVFAGLGLLGAIVGLVDYRVIYHRAPKFETLLAERPPDATGRLRPAPQLRRSDVGRVLPPVEALDVGLLSVLGIGGLAGLVWFAGTERSVTVLRQVDWGGVALAVGLVVLGLVVASAQLLVSSRRRVRIGDAAEVSVASAFLGPVQPSLGPLGLDAHFLTRLGRNRAVALADTRVRLILGMVASLGVVAALLTQADLGSLPTPVWPAFWYVPLLWCALLVIIGGARGPDRLRRLVVRPGWAALKDLGGLARTDPLRAAVLAAASLALPLIELATFVVVAVAAHDGVEFGRLAAVWAGARVLAVVSPLNRGVGFLEPLATVGLVAVGVPLPYAVVTVLVHRLITLWLPMVPGAWATRRLRHDRRI